MTRYILATLAVFFPLAVSYAAPAPAETPPAAKAGFAERNITPAIGMEQPGGYMKAFHRKFHDACKARAAVFENNGKVVALVGLDSLIIREPQVAEARRRINERTGIATDAIMIGASHSHSSGPVGMVLPCEFDDADDHVKKIAYEQSSAADPGYLELVVESIASAVTDAYMTRSDLKIGFGRGQESTVSFNRRWKMKGGFTYTHPGYGNPDNLEPAGPTDPEVGVIGAWDEDNNLVGCIVNFACHATASPGGISANYVWALEKVIKGTYGEDTVVVFLNGASGDVTQVDNSSPRSRVVSGEPSTMFVGGRIGAEAVKVLLEINSRTSTDPKVEHTHKVLDIPRRKPSAEHLAKSKELAAERPKDSALLNDWIWAKEIVMLDAMIAKEPVRKVEVQAIQIGPAVFVSSPAEYFCRYGLEQKDASEFPFTWPVSLANGCVGYVPTLEAFGPEGGGYETRLTSYSNLIPEAGNQIRDAGIALIKTLKPGPVPELPEAAPFTAPWAYGNVPAQKD